MSAFICPGAAAISGTPTLEVKRCPDCGGEIEIFSNEQDAVCNNCGRVIYNDLQSCIRWCEHARECVGDEKYFALMEAFEKAKEKK
ncbi:MAG: hypothetical protein IJH51_01470 [Christensenellaceae bacterium]|nr:hypothetical protein [Christensenellaceae bacterium]